jgi:RNA polymerase sigma factor (sigma-70 family)
MSAEEFKEKVLPVNQKLFRLAFRFLGNLQEAEDTVQEVFLKLWNMRHKLGEINKIDAFATTMTKNLCLDKLKSKRMFSIEDNNLNILNRESASEDPHRLSEQNENMDIVKKIVDTLPEQMKSIMIMRDMEEYSFEEIHEITGLTLNNIRVNLSRARKQVKNELIRVHEYGTERDKNAS